jgi:hypothetical protein
MATQLSTSTALFPRWSRRRKLFGVVAGLSLATAGLVVLPASATHYEASLEGSDFEIDNDANLILDTAAPMMDWATVTEARQDDEPSGQNDDSYQGGTKEDTACPDETTGSIPNNKSDLLTFGVYEEEGDPGYLHMFWSRVNEPTGTTLMDFEFNQSDELCGTGPNVVRTEGDLLVEYSIDQGGARADITLREWTGTAWGPANPLSGADATGTINTSPIPAAESDGLISSGELSPRTFGEASIDLSVIFDENKCESFGSAMLKSRASDSFTSQLKDFIRPVPIELTNCGKVIIRKQTDPASPTTPLFDYAKTFNTDPASADTFSLADDGVQTFDGVLFGTGYTVDEDLLNLPTGWDFVDVDCDASTGVTPVISGATVTFDIDDEDDVLDCTYNNRARGTIIVEKVTNTATGSFDFTSSTLSPSPFTLTTTATGQAGKDSETFSDLAPGTYDVAETVPAGWDLVSATCDDGSDPASIGLGAGETVTCTFVDEPQTGAIEITKTRKHAAAGSGDHPHAGVTFTVTDSADNVVGSGVTDADGKLCIDGLLLSSFAGDYTVTETVPAGYVADGATSKDVTVVNASDCGDGNEATVSFSNTPLTDVSVSVDSQVDGGTASTIQCVGTATSVDESGSTGPNGDGSLSLNDLTPDTYVCTIVVDP